MKECFLFWLLAKQTFTHFTLALFIKTDVVSLKNEREMFGERLQIFILPLK